MLMFPTSRTPNVVAHAGRNAIATLSAAATFRCALVGRRNEFMSITPKPSNGYRHILTDAQHELDCPMKTANAAAFRSLTRHNGEAVYSQKHSAPQPIR